MLLGVENFAESCSEIWISVSEVTRGVCPVMNEEIDDPPIELWASGTKLDVSDSSSIWICSRVFSTSGEITTGSQTI